MSIIKGYGGSIKAGATPTAVGEVRSYTITRTADVQETTTLGDAWAKNTATIKRWTASFEAHIDVSDLGQDEFETAFADGTALELEFYQGGESGAGNRKLAGTAVIDSMGDSNEVASIVTVSISVTGTGALTPTKLA